MIKSDYDVFLAYHGSYGSDGAKKTADVIYDYLVSLNLKVFYFPKSGRDTYKANVIDVMRSRTFLLICNEKIAKTPDKRIDHAQHYHLSTEIDAFYALTQFGDNVSVQDSKILVTGDYAGREGEESKLHELFANRTHFFLKDIADLREIGEWIKERVRIDSEEETTWQQSQTTKEVKKVFAKRSYMSQKCNLSQMVASAKSIRCVGISNSELAMKLSPEAMRFALTRGASIEILFLDPNGKYTADREREEDFRPGKIGRITKGNIEHCLDFSAQLNDEQKERYKLLLYDVQPRLNMIIIDDTVLLQYYANQVPGMNNPCFLIKKQDGESPLYDFCVASYNELLRNAKQVDEGDIYE